jgi:hypothetical protein
MGLGMVVTGVLQWGAGGCGGFECADSDPCRDCGRKLNCFGVYFDFVGVWVSWAVRVGFLVAVAARVTTREKQVKKREYI